jgi:hypothetical protein
MERVLTREMYQRLIVQLRMMEFYRRQIALASAQKIATMLIRFVTARQQCADARKASWAHIVLLIYAELHDAVNMGIAPPNILDLLPYFLSLVLRRAFAMMDGQDHFVHSILVLVRHAQEMDSVSLWVSMMQFVVVILHSQAMIVRHRAMIFAQEIIPSVAVKMSRILSNMDAVLQEVANT